MSSGIFLGRFYGIDSIIELFIVVVSFLISAYSNKIYKIIKEKDYRYFSLAFLSIGIAFIFKIISNFTFFYRAVIEKANFFLLFVTEFESMEIVHFLSYILYKTLFTLGFLILFLIISKTDKKDKIFLLLYLSAITTLFSIYFDFVFHLTIVIIALCLALHFYDNHLKVKTKNSFLVFFSFLIMLLSGLFFTFSNLHSVFYIIGESLLLLGFFALLVNQIKPENEEKNKTRDSKGHFRGAKRK